MIWKIDVGTSKTNGNILFLKLRSMYFVHLLFSSLTHILQIFSFKLVNIIVNTS